MSTSTLMRKAAITSIKERKLGERCDRSLYVTFKNKSRVERERIVEILEEAHPNVERVYLHRQKVPRRVYVLCKEALDLPNVTKALKELDNDELGPVFPKIPKKKEVISTEKSEVVKSKRVLNPCILLLEWIPIELSTDELERAFPGAIKINRFNKRRCYVHFKTPEMAMEARRRISKEKICGHKLTVTFDKPKE